MFTGTVISSVAAYIATNIDDIFINILVFSQVENKKQTAAAVCGKYIGTALLVAAACFGASFMQAVAGENVRFMGLIPILLGIKEAVRRLKAEKSDNSDKVADRAPGINMALLTLAGGADNIGIYIPLFAGYRPVQLAIMLTVFTVMTAVRCYVSARLAFMPSVRYFLHKYSRIAVPAVYIGLGLYIIMV